MFTPLLERIALGLEKRQIAYMIIGGQAVLIYGEPRLTRDMDVTLGVGLPKSAGRGRREFHSRGHPTTPWPHLGKERSKKYQPPPRPVRGGESDQL
jgi:hypothetical protein